MTENRGRSAELFRQLHTPGNPLIVGNAWDAASAVAFQHAGFKAVATTSGGLAWANGYADGNQIARETLLGSVRRILAVLDTPLSVDIEGGFAREAPAIAALVAALSEQGVAGINLEDSWNFELVPVEEHANRIAAAREASSGLFLNARIDTFFFGTGSARERLDDTITRAIAFAKAGADGIFVPGLADLELIRELTAGVDVPVNIMTGPGGPSVQQLAEAGVARVSFGTALAEAAYSRAYDLALQLCASTQVDEQRLSLDYPTLNALLARPEA